MRYGQRTRVTSRVATWLPASGFNPVDLNPSLWLDAADTTTITASLGAVSEWRDKSSNGWHVTQSTAINQPTTGSATQNGRNVISFDGSNDTMSRTGTFDIGTAYTIAVVATPSSGTDDYVFMLGRVAATVGQSSIISKFLSRSYESYNFLGTPTPVESRYTLGSSSLSGYNTLIVIRNGSSMTSLVNGSSSNSGTFTATSITFDRIFVGSSDAGNNFNGQIGEIVVCNAALSGVTLSNLSDYLRQKWATP